MADSIGLGISALTNNKIENDLGEILFISATATASTGLAIDGSVKEMQTLSFTKEVKSIAVFTNHSYGAYAYNALRISDSVSMADYTSYYYLSSNISIRNTSNNTTSNGSVSWQPVLSTNRKTLKIYLICPNYTGYTLLSQQVHTSINIILFYSDNFTYV